MRLRGIDLSVPVGARLLLVSRPEGAASLLLRILAGLVRPLLSQLCRRIEHVGPAGAGASMKLAVNLPLLVYYQALAEALSLLDHRYLSFEKILDIFTDTSGAPAMLKNRGPQIAAVLAGQPPPPPSVDVDTIRKDLREMLAEARSLGVELPLVAAALARYDEASRAGLGDKDCTVLPAFKWGRTLFK